MRTDILELLWAANEEAVYITKQQFMAGFEDWAITPHYENGTMVGATISKGSEFHFATFGGKWKMTRTDIRRYLDPILEQYGCVTTRTPKNDARQIRFNKILGFTATGEDEFFVHYKLDQSHTKYRSGVLCPL